MGESGTLLPGAARTPLPQESTLRAGLQTLIPCCPVGRVAAPSLGVLGPPLPRRVQGQEPMAITLCLWGL